MADLIRDDPEMQSILKATLEIARAQHGHLIREKNGQWLAITHAEIDADSKATEPSKSETINTESSAIIKHVARTKDLLVLSDATNAGQFADDPLIQQRRPKSILCVPSLPL